MMMDAITQERINIERYRQPQSPCNIQRLIFNYDSKAAGVIMTL